MRLWNKNEKREEKAWGLAREVVDDWADPYEVWDQAPPGMDAHESRDWAVGETYRLLMSGQREDVIAAFWSDGATPDDYPDAETYRRAKRLAKEIRRLR